MAKSLRAKCHMKAKSIKRKNVFQVDADARANRISHKMKEDLIKQKMEELQRKNPDVKSAEEAREAVQADDMEQDDKKVSTSGWRDARHHNYKRNKKLNKSRKKGSFTKF
ncbi:LADA_0D02432g1_1 [Lachancea dasiensis]|uniref:LADA_0D02432g1_1 n=1 Tax=Lachancea dasiensis TaxID=1072105 RepID=A0A1G4J4C9_9SACH|nr:LADA_0D02432g1_1 [Lachancea dasiensis]